MRKEYVGYIRVAHKDEYAVESQKMYIENYAKSRNIKIDCYYIDDGYSGRKFERPQLIQMLREQKGAVIESPYKKNSNEDIEFRKKKILELEKQGIYNIRFIYKDDMKKKVGTRDERN